MTVFIYQPTTGDRVFSRRESAEIIVLTWGNGSRHVVGGTHVTVGTASPGAHWRQDAINAATAIVTAAGGIAWDEQGLVHLVVPTRCAPRAASILLAVGANRVPADERDRVAVAAGLHLDHHGRWAADTEWRDATEDERVGMIGTMRQEEIPARGDRPARMGWRIDFGSDGIVRAPVDWAAGGPAVDWPHSVVMEETAPAEILRGNVDTTGDEE